MNAHPAVRIEGGLLGPDTLEQLLAAQLPGQRPADFGLSPRRTLTEEIAAVFSDARALWQVFRRRLERLAEGDLATSETRELWMVPFLRLLDYELRYSPRARAVDGLTFAVSHYAGEEDHAPPVHLVGYRQELGRLAPSGRPRLSPHALVQEYLNRSEALWGLVSNGRTLRLLRDSTFVRRQAYVEFDLEAILEEERFADFVLLYRLLHRTRLPQKERAEECLLEQYYQQSIEQGGRVREHLREGVEQAIEILANGFLGRPAGAALRDWVRQAGELAFFRQLLRLIYRLLFLLVAEERGLMGGDPLYRQGYSISRLRGLTEQRAAWTDDADLWHGLRALWQVLTDEKLAPLLGVPPLNGELFAPQELDNAVITNRDLLGALWHLAFYDSPPRRVNYAALDTEELGSVYESLLDYHPTVTFNATGKPHFELTPGSERKSTGSYYTPPQLVSELIRSALEPVIAERLQKAGDPEQALLSIKVCDPACGSGHFLLAAARRLGKELARIRSGEDEPAPEQIRAAIREVVAHCIYGVDKNPLAVELARVALWLESHAEGKPLTFLEHRIKCGDSLVGVFDLEVLKDGLPDDAFTPLQGDDKKTAASVKRQNKAEREGQMTLFGWNLDLRLDSLAALAQEVDAIPDDSPAAVRRKRARYAARTQDPAWQRQKDACDLWTAAFFQRLSPALSLSRSQPLPVSSSPAPLTTDAVRRALAGQAVDPQTLAEAQALAAEVNFFHWPLEFPEVFAERKEARAREDEGLRAREDEAHALPRSTSPALSKGFDVILANPPWEQIQLEEQEFFAERDARIAGAPNAAARKRLIERLPQENPTLWADYRRALHTAESASRFLRGSGAYPLTGRGRINTYSVFAERIRQLIASDGRAGVIVPTGIATDATNQYFFADLVEEGQIVSLFDFENREKLFPAVDSRMKFSLLTLGGFSRSPALPLSSALTLSFFATRADHLRDPRRVFTLTAKDIARINPNTRTLPVFRTRQDAELTSVIYRRVPVLINETADENPWGASFKQGLFNMSSDSHLFRTRAELEAQGYRLVGNVFAKADELERMQREHETSPALPLSRSQALTLSSSHALYLPLYEAKMIWHYDHRFGAYEGVTDRSSTQLPTPDDRQHADPHFLALPWYWVDAAEVGARLGAWTRGWLLGFRNVCRSTDERTAIFSLSPLAGVGNSLPILLPDEAPTKVACLVGNLSALVFDWVARQKLAGVNMNFFYVQQFPVLPPAAYTPERLRFIVPRVLELTYTAWDLAPFAADLWHDADASLRAAMQAQWQANQARSPALPLSRSPAPPFPPFRWDEARRALLRAELDAYYARLYGLTRKQLRYLLDPADLTARELEDILDPWEEVADALDPQGYAERVAASDFPGETFRVLKEKEIRACGEYRTRRLVLEAWEVV